MIAIQDFHFSYKRRQVFNGLHLQLQRGHIYGLLGRNGTGKSTLLRSITGLLFPGRGCIEVMGFTPGKRQPGFLQELFLVPEEFYLPPVHMKDLVKYHAALYPRFDKAQFEKHLREFDVPGNCKLDELSYGQRKKTLISLGLAANTSVLLMDEPTNGLDIISKSQFRKIMAGAIDENKCVVISTHQVKDLENLIDRIIIIDEGQILFDQSLENISLALSFRASSDQEEAKTAIYSETSLRGHVIVTQNFTGQESKLDLELLYKAIVTNHKAVQAVFNS